MAYDPDNTVEIDTAIPKDHILDAVVISIEEGTYKEKVNSPEKWPAEILNENCIKVVYEYDVKGAKVKGDKLFRFRYTDDGKVSYTAFSDMGKYAAKYGGAPKVGQIIKVEANEKGYPDIRLK